MTYFELMKHKLGDNEQTLRILSTIAANAGDLVKGLVTMEPGTLESVRAAYERGDGEKIVGEMINYILNVMDVMTIPNDGRTPLTNKAGSTLIEVMAMNKALFDAKEETDE